MNRLGTESKMRVRERDRASYNWQKRGVFAAGVAIGFLLSACATSTQPPNSHLAIRHLQQVASWFNRCHAMAPDDLMGSRNWPRHAPRWRRPG